MFSRKTLLRTACGLCDSGAGGLARSAAEDPQRSFRFGAIGDPGTGEEGQWRVARRMEQFHARNPWAFVLSLGDNVYEHGEPAYFENKFKSVYRPLMKAGVRFHSCLGNHDCEAGYEWAQLQDKAFGYLGSQDEYAFEASGPEGTARTQFICLNSCAWIEALEFGDRPEVEQRLRRLRGWLAAPGEFAWRILFLHHPLYSYVKQPLEDGYGGHGSAFELRQTLEPEIAGRVQVVLAGHDHFYQKTSARSGAHHFVSGAAARARAGVEDEHPDVEFASLDLHFMDFQAFEDRLIYQAVNERGEVFHRGAIHAGGREAADSSLQDAVSVPVSS